MADLALYYRPSCPYCRKVLAFMEENNIQIPLKDVGASPDDRETLLTTGGKSQVPCLFIDGRPLYESDDIIAWLKDNAGQE